MFRTGHFSVVINGVFPDFIYAVAVECSVLGWDAQIEVVDVVGVDGHTSAVAAFGAVPIVMERMASILHPCVPPCRAGPSGVPIHVGGLGVVDMRIGDDWVLILVEGDLPHPVSDVCALIDDGGWIAVGIGVGLAHVEHPIVDDAQLLAVDVAQDGAVALVDVDHVEIKPVGHFVVGMPGGVAHVNLVFSVALIFGVWPCTGGLHDLLRTKIEFAVVACVRHGEPCNGGMPVDASPAKIDMLWVITENERRRIGGVIGGGEVFLFAEAGDVTRLG